MIGQPTETAEDVEAIVDLARRMLERLRVLDAKGHPFGRLTLSISSFVPKPWTPFQWAPFDGAESLQSQARDRSRMASGDSPTCACCTRTPAKRRCRRCWRVVTGASPTFVEQAARLDGDWRRALREWDGDPPFYTTRRRSPDERMPWDHFDVGVKKAGLLREWERAAAEPSSPPVVA